MKAKPITFVALLVSITVVSGLGLYSISILLPFFGSKFLIMAPFLAWVMLIARMHLQSLWTMTLVSAVFGTVLSAVNPVMGLAAFLAGILSDLTFRLIPYTKTDAVQHCIAAALFPMYCFIIAFYVTDQLTNRALFGALSAEFMIIGAVSSYALGIVGSLLGRGIAYRVLRQASDKLDNIENQ